MPKKYCKLENGGIVSCYYLDENGKQTDIPRRIFKDGEDYYIVIGFFAHSGYFTLKHKIVAFADTKEELVR